MSISWTRTRYQLAQMALRKLGVLAAGGADVSADLEVCYEAMDARLKELHRLGIVWRKVDRVPFEFSVSASTQSASATADILFPISLHYRDTSTDQPIYLVGTREWSAIPDKGATGTPQRALWKGSAEFLFHPIPTAAGRVFLTYEKYADDTSHGAAPDVDVAMLRWMRDLIVYDVGDDFGQSEDRMKRFMVECRHAELNIRRLAVERKDLSPVAVEQWDSYPWEYRRSDYGRFV